MLVYLILATLFGLFTGIWIRSIYRSPASVSAPEETAALTVPLVEEQANYRAIINTTVDGIVTTDCQGLITLFNPAAEKIFGYQAKEVLGQPISMLMPEPYRSQHQSYMAHYLQRQVKQAQPVGAKTQSVKDSDSMGMGRELAGLRKNGEQFPIYLAVNQVSNTSQSFFTAIVRDISKQKSK